MGGIDYYFFDLTISNVTSNNSNVESMATSNVAIVEVVHLVVIKVKIALWKPHHHSSIYCDFFVVNDNQLIDIVNPSRCWDTLSKFEQASENILSKSCFIIRRGLTKYNKYNGVMPMKTH